MQHQSANPRASQQHANWQQPSQQLAGPAQQQRSAAAAAAAQQAGGHHSHVVPATAAPASGEGAGWGLEQSYDLLGKIGEGTYGVVYLATSKQDKKRVFAIKKFKTGRVRYSCGSD